MTDRTLTPAERAAAVLGPLPAACKPVLRKWLAGGFIDGSLWPVADRYVIPIGTWQRAMHFVVRSIVDDGRLGEVTRAVLEAWAAEDPPAVSDARALLDAIPAELRATARALARAQLQSAGFALCGLSPDLDVRPRTRRWCTATEFLLITREERPEVVVVTRAELEAWANEDERPTVSATRELLECLPSACRPLVRRWLTVDRAWLEADPARAWPCADYRLLADDGAWRDTRVFVLATAGGTPLASIDRAELEAWAAEDAPKPAAPPPGPLRLADVPKELRNAAYRVLCEGDVPPDSSLWDLDALAEWAGWSVAREQVPTRGVRFTAHDGRWVRATVAELAQFADVERGAKHFARASEFASVAAEAAVVPRDATFNVRVEGALATRETVQDAVRSALAGLYRRAEQRTAVERAARRRAIDGAAPPKPDEDPVPHPTIGGHAMNTSTELTGDAAAADPAVERARFRLAEIPDDVLRYARRQLRGEEIARIEVEGWHSRALETRSIELAHPDGRRQVVSEESLLTEAATRFERRRAPLALDDLPDEVLRIVEALATGVTLAGLPAEPPGWRVSHDAGLVRVRAPDGRAQTFEPRWLAAQFGHRPRPEETTTMDDDPASIVKTLQSDATAAAWRTAGSQFVKLAREPLVGLLSRHLGPDDPAFRARVAAFLETEIGTALLASLLSAGLAALPAVAGEVPQRLSRELRVRAMADAGDVVAEVLIGPLRQVMALYLRDMPIEVAPAGPPAALADGARVSNVTNIATASTPAPVPGNASAR